MIGVQTYIDAPPMSAFVDEKDNMIFDQKTIVKGQEVFHKYALMEYGSYFGDGAQRGPDFTADALHQISQSMVKFYLDELKQLKSEGTNQYDVSQIEERVKAELKINRYDKASDLVRLSPAQVYAHEQLQNHYLDVFINDKESKGALPADYIKSPQEVKDLSSFFNWGAWVCVHLWAVGAIAEHAADRLRRVEGCEPLACIRCLGYIRISAQRRLVRCLRLAHVVQHEMRLTEIELGNRISGIKRQPFFELRCRLVVCAGPEHPECLEKDLTSLCLRGVRRNWRFERFLIAGRVCANSGPVSPMATINVRTTHTVAYAVARAW